MASLLAAYWMGLAAADRAALIDQVAQLQAQLQQVIKEREALRERCDANYRVWLAESTSHQRTQAELDAVVNVWTPPSRSPRSHP